MLHVEYVGSSGAQPDTHTHSLTLLYADVKMFFSSAVVLARSSLRLGLRSLS